MGEKCDDILKLIYVTPIGYILSFFLTFPVEVDRIKIIEQALCLELLRQCRHRRRPVQRRGDVGIGASDGETHHHTGIMQCLEPPVRLELRQTAVAPCVAGGYRRLQAVTVRMLLNVRVWFVRFDGKESFKMGR